MLASIGFYHHAQQQYLEHSFALVALGVLCACEFLALALSVRPRQVRPPDELALLLVVLLLVVVLLRLRL
jgi:hypothetical protein